MKIADGQRIKKIYENASNLSNCIAEKGITKELLLADLSTQWMVTTPLYNIGEHAYQISNEYKKAHPEIEWDMIAGLRHRLVHDYDGTNWNIIAEVVFEEIPVLIKQLAKIIEVSE